MTINNINDLSQYLYSMNELYCWPKDKWGLVEDSISTLNKRANDKRLYLGIVGEFSAGKSTLINALFGIELLKEDILPGTTCAPTLLCYGKRFDVEIYRAGSEKVIRYSKELGILNNLKEVIKRLFGKGTDIFIQVSKAKDFIARYSAEEEFAKEVSKVVITLPMNNPILQNDIVIVDTPGINADNPRHQEVTEDVIRNICDLAIVLTPAQTPCSHTLISFIHEHLESLQEYCICFASQIDRVRKNERKRQIKYIAERFQSEDIHFLKTYAIAACYAIKYDDKPQEQEAKEFHDGFAEAMSFVCADIKNNRDLILRHKLQSILNNIINSMLTPMLQKTTDEVKHRFEELQRNKLSDFDTFIQNGKQYVSDEFMKEKISDYDIERIVGNAVEIFTSELLDDISRASSKKALKSKMNKKYLEFKIKSIQETEVHREILYLQEQLCNSAHTLISNFKNSFNVQFRNLGQYIESSSIEVDIPSFEVIKSNKMNVVTNSMKDSKWLMFGGATTGGIIGSCISPGIGTLIGAGIGLLIGSVFAKPLEEYKKQSRDLVMQIADQWKTDLDFQIRFNIISPYHQYIYDILIKAVESFTKYRDDVEKIIQEERNQQEQLKELIKHAKNDMETLQNVLNNPNFSFSN